MLVSLTHGVAKRLQAHNNSINSDWELKTLNMSERIEEKIKNAGSLEESLEILEILLSNGYSVWEDDSLYSIKQLVAQVNGLKIRVFSREHPPPHFHISGGGIDAIFTVSDCKYIEGKIGWREEKLVKWWHQRSKPTLIEAWNNSRPSDCPVGPIVD